MIRLATLVFTASIAGLLPAARAADDAPEREDWTARYQSTYNWQRYPSFRADYSGRNSLRPSAERMYTFSATAHWGRRLWEGGEIYVNPEVVTGVPFSGNVVGLAGVTNGEITRTGGAEPTLYRQRLFLRQTWNRGGGTQTVESDFNQLAGIVDRNRTVLTVGNFSILDVFDDNAYAKDPRTQFMNWGHWTHAAWDYAADARGFGWGAAVEVYEGDWVLRLARMTGPRVPNGLQVDYALGRHYGDQVELEHAHTFAGRPGKVRLLAYRNRAVLASFDDARRYLRANPGADPQAILQVRNGEKIKYGAGINLEQSIADDVGVFLRALQSDGRTETYAFTEADGSLAAGVLVNGTRWGRAADALGVAVSRNTLSRDRRQYLEAGGVSFFIGDGALAYRPEQILETFYSLRVHKAFWVTGDVQRIANPAYNAARGPVTVYAVRLHAEF